MNMCQVINYSHDLLIPLDCCTIHMQRRESQLMLNVGHATVWLGAEPRPTLEKCKVKED